MGLTIAIVSRHFVILVSMSYCKKLYCVLHCLEVLVDHAWRPCCLAWCEHCLWVAAFGQTYISGQQLSQGISLAVKTWVLPSSSHANHVLDSQSRVASWAFGMQILDLMAQEKGWWWPRRRAELKKAREYLRTFHATPEVPARAEIAEQADAISFPSIAK